MVLDKKSPLFSWIFLLIFYVTETGKNHEGEIWILRPINLIP